jgi:RNA polymerase sigma-70 factor (ECF subfamily)
MADGAPSDTRITLLARLARSGETDQAAWAEFVEHYGRKIYRWCERWHLQPADAQDVTQSVLLKLAVRMKDFRYDATQSFRAWLKTVTHHAWRDYLDSRERTGPAAGREDLETLEAREDLVLRLEEEFDRELLEQAMEIVRVRAAPHNWKAFCLTALEGVPAPEVARRLQMKIARVYAARSSIQERLQEEVQRLEEAQCLAASNA